MNELPLDAETGKLEATIIAVAIHRAGINPVFGEEVIQLSVDDEGGGPFVVLKELRDDSKEGIVRLDFEELVIAAKVAKSILGQAGFAEDHNPSNTDSSDD